MRTTNSYFSRFAMVLLILWMFLLNQALATNYTLTVSAQGAGIVTKNPTNASYPAGVVVTITAISNNPSWYFSNWSGDTNGSINPLNVQMNSDLVITGNFLPFPTFPLTVITNGQGGIALNPPGGNYLSNTLVTATATPAAGWVFVNWSGVTNAGANPVSFLVNTNSSLTGAFAQLPVFDVQPVSVTNTIGSTINFTSDSLGTAPVSYQWYFSGGAIPAVNTNATLSLTNVSLGEAGNYWVVAANNYGSVTSQVASLVFTNVGGATNVVYSPGEANLRAAIAVGGWIGFGFNGAITLANPIIITNHVILDGSGVNVAISGGNAVRLFYVTNDASLTVSNLTLTGGAFIITNSSQGTNADGGAIYNNGGTVTLVGCTLTNNSAQSLIYDGMARGGAVYNNTGSVSLVQSWFVNNSVVGGGGNIFVGSSAETGLGGALYNAGGSVSISGCTFTDNICSSVCEATYGVALAMGGAAFQSAGTLSVANSTFAGNQVLGGTGMSSLGPAGPSSPAYGGAMAITGGTLSIAQSQFASNLAQGGDAGYHNVAGSALGGAIYSAATLVVSDSSFYNNTSLAGKYTAVPQAGYTGVDGYGGAICNVGSAVLNRCSVYSNVVQGGSVSAGFGSSGSGGDALGGGIFNSSVCAVTNCTVALNSAIGGLGQSEYVPPPAFSGSGLGGGIFNSNAVFLGMNLTIASNLCTSLAGYNTTNGVADGFQIANTNGTLRLHNSLVAYSGTNNNAFGPITDDGYNIGSDGSANFSSGSSYNFTDPQLAVLGNYGGPTWCMALQPASPAIDNADPLNFPGTDQRGYIRPIGGGPDMGAYEYGSQPLVIPVLSLAAGPTNVIVSFTASPPLTYRFQASPDLRAWTDLSTNGPFATATNLVQAVNLQGYSTRYFRVLMQ